MDNDSMRHDFAEMMALVQDQMRDLSVVQQKRLELAAKAKAADGTVEVTVDAQGMVTEIVIDESYLDEFELAELGGHITGAARAAAQDIGRRAAALLEPMRERRATFRSLADIAVDVPGLGDVLSHMNLPPGVSDRGAPRAGGDGERWDGSSSYPNVGDR